MGEWHLRLHPDAEIDALNGYEWYAERNSSAADSFRLAITNAGQIILRDPLAWPAYKYGTQKYKLRQFPYKIIYIVEDDQVLVVAIAHDRRRPGYWLQRLDRK
ncbi:type II toxin-antitoxin system RelE/ParE family toxin [Mariniblastus sp.]|nr:type II toxin-antitoxin system RelE/ParE family toxin [Mariniblastus sp.]